MSNRNQLQAARALSACASAVNVSASTAIGSARAWWIVTLLSTLYVLSFIDRLILALLVGPLKAGLGVSDVQLGLLFGPAFGLFYAVVGLPLARLADRGDRRRLIIAGVLLWSLATTASGFAGTFALLLLLRVGLAIGEAALTPAAYSMMGDLFPPQQRTLAASIYSGVGQAGAFAAFIMGSLIIQAVDGAARAGAYGFQTWQLVFFTVGIPSVVVGIVFACTTREPARTSSAATSAPSFAEVVRYVRRNAPLYVGLLGGAGLLQAISAAWTAWGAELARREYAWSIQESGIAFGTAGLLAGFSGTLLFPIIARRIQNAGRADALALTSMAGVVGGAVFAVCAALQSTPIGFFCFVGASMFCTTGGANNVLVGMQTLAPASMRATLVAGVLLSITVLGMCIGPPLSAAIASRISADGAALGSGIAILSVLVAACSFSLFAWSRRGLNTNAADQLVSAESPGADRTSTSHASLEGEFARQRLR